MEKSDLTHAQAPDRDDPLRAIINELNGVPTVGDNELTDARDHPITLELTNRFAHVRGRKNNTSTYEIIHSPFAQIPMLTRRRYGCKASERFLLFSAYSLQRILWNL